MLETFLSLSWVWLILHTALSTYTLSYQWAWMSLIDFDEVEMSHDRPGQATLGYVIIVLSAILKCVSGRPRHCSICRKKCGDRVYHDTAFGRCRPLFDHYCSFILVSVYLRTMKLYLFMLFFLPLDVIFTIVSSAFATSQSSGKSAAMFFAPIITASFAIGFLAAVNALSQMYHLAWKNEVQNEYTNRNLEPITLVFKVGVRHRRAILWWKQCKFNPWDLGLKENLKQVFGSSISARTLCVSPFDISKAKYPSNSPFCIMYL
ncbi:putative dhhc zinc finger domain-containing protein [Eutypa lata UCREL1]|uniref:Palmitoyltransferase n=1 Tax=Eutypa lata (strain UCR-EL1) TaxID=1287681 RepID=M7T227_EUTLA|nr:putative dhhc zinc finger domain-containing protein [Eutypa lata UCREL1]